MTVLIPDLTKQPTLAVTISVRIGDDDACPEGESHFDLQDWD